MKLNLKSIIMAALVFYTMSVNAEAITVTDLDRTQTTAIVGSYNRNDGDERYHYVAISANKRYNYSEPIYFGSNDSANPWLIQERINTEDYWDGSKTMHYNNVSPYHITKCDNSYVYNTTDAVHLQGYLKMPSPHRDIYKYHKWWNSGEVSQTYSHEDYFYCAPFHRESGIRDYFTSTEFRNVLSITGNSIIVDKSSVLGVMQTPIASFSTYIGTTDYENKTYYDNSPGYFETRVELVSRNAIDINQPLTILSTPNYKSDGNFAFSTCPISTLAKLSAGTEINVRADLNIPQYKVTGVQIIAPRLIIDSARVNSNAVYSHIGTELSVTNGDTTSFATDATQVDMTNSTLRGSGRFRETVQNATFTSNTAVTGDLVFTRPVTNFTFNSSRVANNLDLTAGVTNFSATGSTFGGVTAVSPRTSMILDNSVIGTLNVPSSLIPLDFNNDAITNLSVETITGGVDLTSSRVTSSLAIKNCTSNVIAPNQVMNNDTYIKNQGNITLPDLKARSITIITDGTEINLDRLTSQGTTMLQLNNVNSELTLPKATIHGNFTLVNNSQPNIKTVGTGDDAKDISVPRVVFKNCIIEGDTAISGNDSAALQFLNTTTKGTTNVLGNQEVLIDGGSFRGNPAMTGNNVVVKRGVFTDLGNASQFIVHEDSESQVSTSGTTTITTVKLSNPPVIIDWADFPGIDLSVDLSAPVIEVIRTPGDSRTPTDKVTLQITATDPSGLKDKETGEEVREAYISINGGKFTQVLENQYIQYDVTENQTVSITARDANGNVRDYNVVITNIDEVPPEVKGFEQSTDNWTKGNVRVYVNAIDDVKLDPSGAYRYTFTPTDGGTPITTDWTKDRFYTTDRNGSLVVEVRDAVGKTTTSDPWMVSNIDIIPPDFTVDLTPDASIKASQKDGVLLTVNTINTADPVTQEASPLANLAVKWDPAEPWSSDFERMVYENGVYNIQVRDSVGNISQVKPVTVSNISDQKPKITSFVGDNLAAQFVPGPVVLTVTAESSDGTPLPDRPYSWDGGKTWTSQNTMSVSYNGEYEVTVRDSVGNTVSAFCLVKNIDATKPTANVYLYKGQPSDWTGPDPATPDDYVWKIRVDTDDIGSGVAMVKTLWNNGAYTTNTTGLTFDVVEAGVFGVLVYDKAGNETYAEKTVTWESIGESAGGSNNNAYVGITAPSTGTAGSPFEDGTSIGDVVYGPEGAYNTKTDEFKPYTPGQEGIVVDLIANSKPNKWISGYATFEGVNYPIKFKDAAGNYVEGPVKGGKNMPCRVYIPISGITKDIKNGRLVTVFQEWNDAAGTDLNREGSETLYTSVQVNPPYIQWSYDKTTGELTISPNSPVAGIASDGVKYNIDGGGDTVYTGPFVVPDGAGNITITAVDKAGNETRIELDVAKLPVSGAGGGNLPTEGADGATGAGGGAVNSYYMAGRTSESYIIGGTRNNTNSIPSGDVFSSIIGSGGGTP